MSQRVQNILGWIGATFIVLGCAAIVTIMTTTTVSALKSIHGTVEFHNDGDGYVREISWREPCALSMGAVRAARGAEDDLCATWIDSDGIIHFGPLSAAPARAHMVGE